MEIHDTSRRIFSGLPVKLDISNGNLVGITGHDGWCYMGLFIIQDKFSKFKVSKNGNQVLENVLWWIKDGKFGLMEIIDPPTPLSLGPMVSLVKIPTPSWKLQPIGQLTLGVSTIPIGILEIGGNPLPIL